MYPPPPTAEIAGHSGSMQLIPEFVHRASEELFLAAAGSTAESGISGATLSAPAAVFQAPVVGPFFQAANSALLHQLERVQQLDAYGQQASMALTSFLHHAAAAESAQTHQLDTIEPRFFHGLTRGSSASARGGQK